MVSEESRRAPDGAEASAALQQWIAELEAEAGRLHARAREATFALGPSLPLTELEGSTAALRKKIAAGKALLQAAEVDAGAASARPAGDYQPSAMQAMLNREELAARLAGALESALGQVLANAVVELDYSEPLIESDPLAVRDGMRHLKGELQQGLERLRWLVADLRPPSTLNDLGLGPSLLRYIQRFSAYAGLAVRAPTLASFESRLPASMELAIFRVVQEALKNAQRHAAARQVEVGVQGTPAEWTFFVEDDGRGFAPGQPARGLGLIEMRERALAIGGTLRILSRAGGTRVLLTVPRLASA